jgi:hypothetical protein
MNLNDLKRMYGTTPERFKRRVAFALQKTEEKPMKHTVRTILVTAIILLLLTAAAYAAFSSQVLDFFGKSYGNDYKQWLEQGEVAVPNQSLVLDDAVFTVDEIIYRDNGLYGVGTVSLREGSAAVLIAEEYTPDEPFGYDIHGAGGHVEEAPAGTPTIAEVAAEKGGKILMVSYTMPEQIGVDGGEMLFPPWVGVELVPQRDGSIQFCFELSDGVAIADGDIYTILMWSSVCEMTADGEQLTDTRHGENWTVEIAPEPINEPTAEPVAVTAAPEQSIGDVTLIVPEEYTQTGTLPVYSATARDFGAGLNPELFNQSGVAEASHDLIIFNDEAQLSWSPETLFYSEYRGTYNANYKSPGQEPVMIPLESLSHAASDLAGYVRYGWPDEANWDGITLDKTALSGITLAEAKAQVEALLAALNVEGYTCDYALDMDVARIRSMGAQMNKITQENQSWNSPVLDYSQVTEKNEGFYLHYQNGIETGDGRFDLYAYVTQDGIADFQLRDMYIRGETCETPETLVSPESVMAALPAAMANSKFSDMTLDHILSVELAYTPARAADRADGMVFTPAWNVTYRDARAAQQDYDRNAIFNAVDGTLLYAPFK